MGVEATAVFSFDMPRWHRRNLDLVIVPAVKDKGKTKHETMASVQTNVTEMSNACGMSWTPCHTSHTRCSIINSVKKPRGIHALPVCLKS